MTEKKFNYALTFVSADKVGIVALVTDVLLHAGFNIEDSSSTLLRGVFSMIFIVSNKKELSENEIKEMFKNKGITPYIHLLVDSCDKVTTHNGDTFSLSVYAADKPGIVSKVTAFLADNKININDLQTKVTGNDNNKVYIMILEVTTPNNINADWQEILKALAKQNHIDIHINKVESYEF